MQIANNNKSINFGGAKEASENLKCVLKHTKKLVDAKKYDHGTGMIIQGAIISSYLDSTVRYENDLVKFFNSPRQMDAFIKESCDDRDFAYATKNHCNDVSEKFITLLKEEIVCVSGINMDTFKKFADKFKEKLAVGR